MGILWSIFRPSSPSQYFGIIAKHLFSICYISDISSFDERSSCKISFVSTPQTLPDLVSFNEGLLFMVSVHTAIQMNYSLAGNSIQATVMKVPNPNHWSSREADSDFPNQLIIVILAILFPLSRHTIDRFLILKTYSAYFHICHLPSSPWS